jgi:DNA-binding transcriptional LysR family regulator
MLQSNSLHAAIVYAASAARLSDGLVARELVPLDIRVVAPKGLFSSCSLQLADCATQPWVINPEGCVFRRQLVNALLAAGLPFELAMEGFGVELQMQLVARGLGLGLLPLPCIEGSSFRSQVDILDIGDFSINSALWLVHSSMLGNLQQAVDLCARSITDSLIMLPERG